jgi:L-lactate utilization protein LutB
MDEVYDPLGFMEPQRAREEMRELRSEIQQLRDEVRAAREDHLERIEALEREVLPGDEVGLP